MNREIKFRAWIENEKNQKGSSIMEYFIFNPKTKLDDYLLFHGAISLEMPIMQFTGLKDKNGKEIYEGDILEHNLWGKTQIIWEMGMFRGTETKSGIDVTLADQQLKRCRVIGNIYENKDLLKK